MLQGFVHGGVHGVGCRGLIRARARALGVRGWVKNRADGAVEVEAAGDAQSLARLRKSLSEGPPGARVSVLDDLPASAVETDLPEPFAIVR